MFAVRMASAHGENFLAKKAHNEDYYQNVRCAHMPCHRLDGPGSAIFKLDAPRAEKTLSLHMRKTNALISSWSAPLFTLHR